jgi:hypothetical protein
MGHKYGAEIAGAAVGGAVFLAGVGIAKLITAPFRGSHGAVRGELADSRARMAQPVVIVHHEQREVFIHQSTRGRQQPAVIDMGTVEEYDEFDIGNMIDADRRWKADAPRRQADATLNAVFAQAREQQIQAEGGYPWQRQAAWDAEKARKQQLRKEKGLIGSLFSK